MVKKFILKLINFYQIFVSFNLGKNCRFYPSCSEYVQQSLEKHGTIKGLQKGFFRILKCNPLHKGGIDLP